MSFLDTGQGKKLLAQYLKKYKEGSRRVYRSEIKQFFEFEDSSIDQVTAEVLHRYQGQLAKEHTPATTKRKFSILNSFFKYVKKRVKGFENPIGSLKDYKTHRGANSIEFKRYLVTFIEEQNTENTRRNYENQIKLFSLGRVRTCPRSAGRICLLTVTISGRRKSIRIPPSGTSLSR